MTEQKNDITEKKQQEVAEIDLIVLLKKISG